MPKYFFYGLRGSRASEVSRVTRVWARLFAWDNRGVEEGYRRAQQDANRFGIVLDSTVAEEVVENSSVSTHKSMAYALHTTHTPCIVVDHFTPSDVLTVIFHPNWVQGTEYEFFHNGVKIDETRARELIG